MLSDDEQNATREWWHWCYNEEGELIEVRVLEELYDFRGMMDQHIDLVCAITGDRMSKPNYRTEDVLSVYEDHVQSMIDNATYEAVKEVLERVSYGHEPSDILKEYPPSDSY